MGVASGSHQGRDEGVLYTASLSAFEKSQRELKPYYVMKSHRNFAVTPDVSDLEQYGKGLLTWQGFRVNYLAKLMRPEAEEWMKGVSSEAVSEDVVLVSGEGDVAQRYRVFLAEMIINMFSGRMKVRYGGELKI